VTPVLEQLKADYGDDLRVVFRHFPLISIHDKAQVTSEAAEAAGAQGKFWEMHDLLFERQSEWSGVTEDEIINLLVTYAQEIGVDDVDQFRADLEEDVYADEVMADYQSAVDAGLTGTPTFVANRVVFPSREFGLSYQGVDAFLQLMGLRETWYEGPEQVLESDKEYLATIQTEKGDIVVELYNDTAPVNTNSFAFLANEGWYQDASFHRVLEGFVAQGGDPTGTGLGFPGYRCGDEISPSRSFDGPGIVSLANSGPNSNGSQFFITYDSIPELDEGFTIIGKVVEGMDIAEQLTPRDPQNNPFAPSGDKIINITVDEKG
jgi:cyclophilin family peptidyl-prolyl cis-trans isomerase